MRERWIPCRESGAVKEHGLRDVFAQAHQIDEIVDPSPLVTTSLYRLLLAVAHSIFRPLRHDLWEQLWDGGQWPAGEVTRYLDQWEHRFDLFDESRPFYQVPQSGFSPYLSKYERDVSELTHEWGASNASLFSHTRDDFRLSASEAARYLVCRQTFAAGGLHTHEEGKVQDKYVADAPVARAAICVLRGRNLFETLLLNMVDYDPVHASPFPERGRDCPAWEADTYAESVLRRPLGYLDWLTWQSRRVLLKTEPSGTSAVDRVVIVKGAQLPREARLHEYEQMASFWKLPKAKPDQDPNPSVSFRADRALWRDSLALLTVEQTPDGRRGEPPRTLVAAAGRSLRNDSAYQLNVSGVLFKTGQSMVILWRAETLPAPLAYIADKDLQYRLMQALRFADDVGYWLGQATRVFASLLLAPASSEQGGRTGDVSAITDLASSLGTVGDYWAELGTRFYRFLTDQAEESLEDSGIEGYGSHALLSWCTDAGGSAHRALDAATSGEPSGRALKAAVLARDRLDRGVGVARVKLGLVSTDKENDHAVATAN